MVFVRYLVVKLKINFGQKPIFLLCDLCAFVIFVIIFLAINPSIS